MSIHVYRRANLVALYASFVDAQRQKDPSLSAFGLDTQFAASIELGKSSFSSYKSGARPIGDRISRQIEAHLGLPKAWLDIDNTQSVEGKSHDDAQLAKFVKLATRAFKRADRSQRDQIEGLLREFIASRSGT